jgi:hypothetical protein
MSGMTGIIMLVTKEMEVITVTDNIYTILGITIRGGHNTTKFESELACKLIPFSMVYRFQKHKVHL